MGSVSRADNLQGVNTTHHRRIVEQTALVVLFVLTFPPVSMAQVESKAPYANSSNTTSPNTTLETAASGDKQPGQSPEADQQNPVAAEKLASESDSAEAANGEKQQKRKRENLISILLMLLAGVGIIGVGMIAATMIWGGKVRRMVRTPEKIPAKVDPMRNLKPALSEDQEGRTISPEQDVNRDPSTSHGDSSLDETVS